MLRNKPFRSGLVLLSSAFFVACAQQAIRYPAESAAFCPRSEDGETQEDCPWAGWVRGVVQEGKSPEDLPRVIHSSIALDSKNEALHEAWGQSLNFDSGAKSEIVDHRILQSLAKKFGTPILSRSGKSVQHAGLIHTYGYLLSNLKTPFGFKRGRWVSNLSEKGLGFSEGTLRPDLIEQTTLLSRATYLFMGVAHHQDLALWRHLEKKFSSGATRELREFAFKGILRREEGFRLDSGEMVQLVTDLLPFKKDPRGGFLLVYSVRRGDQIRLITGFPVDAKFQERPANPVRPRYNAWVE